MMDGPASTGSSTVTRRSPPPDSPEPPLFPFAPAGIPQMGNAGRICGMLLRLARAQPAQHGPCPSGMSFAVWLRPRHGDVAYAESQLKEQRR
jgi:hypothetical protein